jgi:hypothetical protein
VQEYTCGIDDAAQSGFREFIEAADQFGLADPEQLFGRSSAFSGPYSIPLLLQDFSRDPHHDAPGPRTQQATDGSALEQSIERREAAKCF